MGTHTIETTLRATRPSAATLEDARGRFVDAADRNGLLDVGVGQLDTPIGRLLVAATEQGVVRVGLATEAEDDVLGELAREVSPRVLGAPRRVDPARRELEEYFAGDRTQFSLPLDWRLTRGFRREVLEELVAVPYGATTTYSALAAEAGRPRAVRAAGTALATNPIPIIVPCHRVLRSDGSVGGYRGGADTKQALLALEAGAPA